MTSNLKSSKSGYQLMKKSSVNYCHAALMTRFASLWQPLVGSVSKWMDISELAGEQAIKQGYLNTLDGNVSPQQGVIMRMR